MKEADRIILYKKALKEWGADAQCIMSIEEAAELLLEVSKTIGSLIWRMCKLWRSDEYGKSKITYEKQKMLLQYEIADMDIMIEQLKVIFGEEEIKVCKNNKLEKLKKRLYV